MSTRIEAGRANRTGRWRSLPGRARLGRLPLGAVLVASLSGAATALALAPFHLWPAIAGFGVLLHQLSGAGAGRGALFGWSFGFGHFLAGLYWIAIAFGADAERVGHLAIPAILLLCAGLALFPAAACAAFGALRLRSVEASVLALALLWTVAEWLRGTVFGGFPWNLIGYVWVDLAPAQLAAAIGVHGLSALTVALGAALAVPFLRISRRRWLAPTLALVLLALAWGVGALRLAGAEVAWNEDVRLRLVQGNVAQHHKWDPALRARWFERHLRLSAAPPGDVTHVIWPESATPYAIEQEPVVRARLAEVVPPRGLLITGGERFDLDQTPARAWNSLFVIDGAGALVERYDKVRLVPFGEFLPARDLLGRIGLQSVARGTLDFQAGTGTRTLALPGLPPVGPLICYETIFSGAVVAPGPRPGWLLNITNDAWFGDSSGPYQHLAMARMRAIEEGLPLVRAANTGISAVIDPWGRVISQLALGELGTLDSALPLPLPPPPFARFGAVILILGACAISLMIVGVERRRRATP